MCRRSCDWLEQFGLEFVVRASASCTTWRFNEWIVVSGVVSL